MIHSSPTSHITVEIKARDVIAAARREDRRLEDVLRHEREADQARLCRAEKQAARPKNSLLSRLRSFLLKSKPASGLSADSAKPELKS